MLFLFQSNNKVFCAGLDIMEMYNPQRDRLTEFWRMLQNVWINLYNTRLATVAAINVTLPDYNQSFFNYLQISVYDIYREITWIISCKRWWHLDFLSHTAMIFCICVWILPFLGFLVQIKVLLLLLLCSKGLIDHYVTEMSSHYPPLAFFIKTVIKDILITLDRLVEDKINT